MTEAQKFIALLVPLVSGLFAVLGAFVGGFVSRRTEYEKWFRAERAKVFAEFLRLIHEAVEKSVDALHDTTRDELERNIEVTKAYSLTLTQARIVRLYLPRRDRERFEKLARSILALHSTTSLGDERMSTLQAKLDEIQALFEAQL